MVATTNTPQHKNLKAGAARIRKATAALRNDPTNWQKVMIAVDRLEDRAYNTYAELIADFCNDLRGEVQTARDSGAAWRTARREHKIDTMGRRAPLTGAAAQYHAELRAMRS